MASPTPSPTAPSPTTSSSSPPPAATPPTSSPSTPSPPPPSSTSSPPSPPSSSTKSRPPPPSSSSSKSPPPPPSFSTSTSSSGISTGAVAGIAIAGMAVLVSLCLSWKKRRRRSNDRSVPPPPPGDNTYNSTQGRSNLEMMRNLEDVTTVDDGASSSIAPGSTHEVFLSFRGVDTRLNFTDHLYNYLRSVGVQTFRDNEELRVGEEIGPDLIKAIEESSISIPIFSKGYASSKWCLRELTHMVKCMNDIDPEGRRRHTVCPIFYDVTPEHVKRQTGSFAEAFVKHTKEVDACTVQEWKDALKEVCELKGWEKDKIADGHEAELIKKIVTEVCEKLKKRNVSLTDDLVGMDHHMEEMTKLLDNGGNDVRIVGIVGMGGIGKTTIAKFIYNKLCDQFQPQCSFLEDVRERVKRNGYAELRKQLTSDVLRHAVDRITIDKNTFRDKKVLIVFDDVEDKSQLKDIIGGRESQLATHNYFGSGSTIIVTTRNKEVFEELDGDLIYEPSGMDPDDSLLLFCKYAFKSSRPKEGYEEISREVVQTAVGLPLSLVVIGSMLFLKKRKQWEATLKKLKTIPAKDVQKKLKISYEALDHGQKQMFLDIACHFIGEDKTLPFYMWQDCGLNPESEGIDVLVSLSLVTIEKDRYTSDNDIGVFRMHDHLIDLGRDIVKQENHSHPGQRSRLWSSEEARDVLDNQAGTEKVETFFMNYVRDSDDIIYDFKGLSSLRYLFLEDVRLKGDFKGLVSNLRWFRWRFEDPNGVLDIMPITNVCAKKLVILDLTGSSGIRDGWESEIQIKAATNLKVLRLRGCGRLTKLPECLWNMKSLVELNLSESNIAELSEQGIGNLTNLTILLLFECTRIKRLPDAIGRLKKLEVLNCSWCISLEGQLPEGIERLYSLRVLDLTATKITGGLPKDISGLQNLRTLNLGEKVQLPVEGFKLPHSLKKLSIPLTEASVNGVRGLVNLRALKFHKNVGYCCEPVVEEEAGVIVDHRNNGIPSLPIIDMPSNLERLSLRGLDDHVMSCRLLAAMKFDCSPRLDMLWIDNCTFRTLPTGSLDLSNFQVFKKLRIEGCNKMRETADFGSLLGYTWEWIDISDCQSLEVLLLSNLSSLKRLKTLEITGCLKLREIKGREVLTSLETLKVEDCPLLMGPDLSNCQMLKELSIKHCHEMREIKGFEALTSLVRLYVDNCPLLKEDELLLDLSKLKSLKIVTWNKKEICIPEE